MSDLFGDSAVSWPLVKLDDVSEFIRNGLSINQSDLEEGLPITRIETIADKEINLDRCGYAGLSLGDADEYLLKRGDILISHINSEKHLAKCAIFEFDELYLIHGMNLLCLRPTFDKVYPKYLFYCLSNEIFLRQIKKITKKSVNQASFTVTNFKELEIPLPPLAEQKRIASILDKADAIRRKRQQAIKLADEFLRSVFLDMFGDPVSNPKGWEVRTIEQLIKKEKYALKRGPFGGALKKEIFKESGYLVYEQFHALNDDFTFQRYFIDEAKFTELKAFEVFAGDIIISCSGVNLGRLAIVPDGSPRGIINQALLKVTLDNKKILNEFFVNVFTNPNFKKEFFGDERGSGVPNFPPMSTFKEFKFICPPINFQHEYLKVLRVAKKILEHLVDGLEEKNRLFESLSQKAFSGQL